MLFVTEGMANFLLRGPIGLIFMAHGARKLFGAFGGEGLQATVNAMAQLVGEPSMVYAVAVGSVEFVGGILLMLGLLVRPAAFSLMVVMMVAIRAVHWEHGLFLSAGGYEFALSLMAACAALAFGGAGKYSLDAYISRLSEVPAQPGRN
ncbi:MAG: DoxX family protein [bacterium]